MSTHQDRLDIFIQAELGQPVMEEASFVAKRLADELGEQALAVLFYGSCLRTGDGAGLMDFYVLTKDARGYGGNAVSRFTHWLVPPLVRYYKCDLDGKIVHAKVAVMTLSCFEKLAKPGALDISIWARFAQPAALIYTQNEQIKTRLHHAIRQAMVTAIGWAVCFGPDEGTAGDYWRALFRKTYAAELRIEGICRADLIVDLAEKRYIDLWLPALEAAGFVSITRGADKFTVHMPAKRRRAMKRKWILCVLASKSANLLRILKGAVTFEGRADYVIWKLERQFGVKLELTPWQRAHPLLAAPCLLLQLRRKKAMAKRH